MGPLSRVLSTNMSRNDGDSGKPGLSRRQAAKLETQRKLLRAVREMTAEGAEISVAAAARRAGIGVATAYRYYSDVDALRSDAALELRLNESGPDFLETYRRKVQRLADPLERLLTAQRQMLEEVAASELDFRMFLAKAQEKRVAAMARGEDVAPSGTRRLAMIEEALAPVREDWDNGALRDLVLALMQVTGPEAWLTLRDDAGLNVKEATRANEAALRDIYRSHSSRQTANAAA